MGKGQLALQHLFRELPTAININLNTQGKIKLVLTASGFGKEQVHKQIAPSVVTEKASDDGHVLVTFNNTEKNPLPINEGVFIQTIYILC